MTLIRIILDVLLPPRPHETLVREATPESLGRHADARMLDARIVSLLPYRVPLVKACIVEAKFSDSEKAQRLLAQVLIDHLCGWHAERAALEASAIVLVPVPLSAVRRKDRGYNQAERVAARAVKDLPEITVDASLLERVRDTAPQTALSGEARRRNLEGAFRVSRAPDPAHTYIVFDDVLTTGTTMRASMGALLAGGASRVYGLSLAH